MFYLVNVTLLCLKPVLLLLPTYLHVAAATPFALAAASPAAIVIPPAPCAIRFCVWANPLYAPTKLVCIQFNNLLVGLLCVISPNGIDITVPCIAAFSGEITL